MNVYEKYYRRGDNALNKLIEAYKNGYVLENTLKFREQARNTALNNQIISMEEQNAVIFTVVIALLGLNKESIENTGKFLKYNKNINTVNLRNKDLKKEDRARINAFDSQNIRKTDFSHWLSIITDVPSDIENIDHLRRVRNGLLHSNFYIDDNNLSLNIAHIKTKSYYESEVLGCEFQLFVFEYFSNLERLGLSEKIFTFLVKNCDITTREELFFTLQEIYIYELKYKNLTTVGEDTPELFLTDVTDKEGVIDTKAFDAKILASKNYDDFSITAKRLDANLMAYLFVYIEKNYGNDFYKMDYKTQNAIITSLLQYRLNPKREISNWLMHFWYLYSTLYSSKFNPEYFSGDEFGNDYCLPSLLILKSYLLIYRMQHKDFEELDYSKINFDRMNIQVQLISDNIKTPITTEDYFQESFDKEKAAGLLVDEEAIWNKVICEVVRNSLAHGNVITSIDNNTLQSVIELTDIDQKKGSVRKIKMPISLYEEFLNSEAFNPKYCYTKENASVILSRKKSE